MTHDDNIARPRRQALGVGLKTLMVLVAIMALFFRYQTTVGPWKLAQRDADSEAHQAVFFRGIAAQEEAEAATDRARAATLDEGDPAKGKWAEEAANHAARSGNYTRSAAEADELERLLRRRSWRPWDTGHIGK